MPQNDHDLLIRIDERTRSMQATLTALPPTFVTRKEFAPVRLVVFGLVGVILLSVIGAIVASVLVQKQ